MKTIIVLMLALLAAPAVAEVAVIVHPSVGAAVDADTIARLFLGKAKGLDDGTAMVPINLAADSPTTAEFNKNVLGKSASQLKAYWSQLVFTGKGSPPKELATDAEVLALVAANPNLIGYIDAAAATSAVKVVGKY